MGLTTLFQTTTKKLQFIVLHIIIFNILLWLFYLKINDTQRFVTVKIMIINVLAKGKCIFNICLLNWIDTFLNPWQENQSSTILIVNSSFKSQIKHLFSRFQVLQYDELLHNESNTFGARWKRHFKSPPLGPGNGMSYCLTLRPQD